MSDEGQQPPTEEELRAEFEEQMKRITVSDVIVQTTVTLVNLGAQKLGEDGDTEQAKQAIEAARALLPLCPDDVQTPIKDALSQLQMSFVRATQQPAEQTPQQPEDPAKADEEKARAEARAKLWTPPGT
jgi:hypothetical protein